MRPMFQKLTFLSILLFGSLAMHAQLISGGIPKSLTPDFQARYDQPLHATQIPALNTQRLRKEDRQSPGRRIAAPVSVNLGLDNAGEWIELDNGDRIWRLKVESPNALGLSLLYDELYLPPGAKLFMFSEDGSQILGAYTFESNTPNHTFMTGFIAGNTAILEYYEPKAVRGEGRLHIFRVDQVYKENALPRKNLNNEFGFEASSDCHLNANCPEGSDWQNQKRGICRIMVVVEEGTGFCTGSLMNNTEGDQTPYVLSAFHCQDGFTPMYDFWRFDFNYEGNTCNNPAEEPMLQSVLGSTLRASRRENDFLLLELVEDIPPAYNVYFNGWERSEQPPTTSFSFHHPRGDVKKLSFENEVAIIHPTAFDWQTADSVLLSTSPPDHLFRMQLDEGTVEAGSSGGPLFDQNGRIVGQLHGGTNLGTCGSTTAYYDRFSLSWEGGGTPETRLKDWLDPMNIGLMRLDGADQASVPLAKLAGRVRTADGRGIAGITVRLSGPMTMEMVTDTSGAYEFNDLPTGEVYGVSFDRDFGDKNGVGISDILFISQHILGVRPLDTPYKLLAADVDDSESIGILDIITLRKLILGIDLELTEVDSWRFVPTDYIFTDDIRPWNDFIPSTFHRPPLLEDVTNFDFIGFKMGDVDLNADPTK